MKSARGYSIIELLVATTLGLVILAGVLQVFINTKQGYQVQQSAGRFQENSRFAIEYLSRYILLADFWDGVEPNFINFTSGASPSSGTACPSSGLNSWVVNPANGIYGYAGGSSTSASSLTEPQACIGSGYVPYSDVLVVRFANPEIYTPTACLSGGSIGNCLAVSCPNGDPVAASSSVHGGYWVRSQIGSRAEIFNAATETQVQNDLSGEYCNGVLNYQYQTIIFYLQNIDNGEGLAPTLTMLTVQGTQMVQQPIVDGVEMLKFEYGVDTDNDQVVNQFLPANSVVAWSQVISVRISMVVRGDTIDNYKDSQTYQMTESFCYGPQSPCTGQSTGVSYTGYESYQRRLIVREVQIRNRVRG
ncbi:MAG: PilW family protein [Nevskia sp.]|nr:PilW family protein [Nevskia sp.]